MARKTLKEVGQELKQKQQEKEKERQEVKEVLSEVFETPSEVYPVAKRCLAKSFDFIAKRFGDKWKLEEEELEDLTNSYIALLNKYVPKVITKFSVEVDALICTAFVILKRLP